MNDRDSPFWFAFQKAWQTEPHILLCDKQARKGIALAAVNGECPAHGGDACLFMYGQIPAIRHRLGEIEREASNE